MSTRLYRVYIRKQDSDGWYFRCPEHHDSNCPGTGPYRTWDMAMELANLHLRNFNHF